jgi:hypothetical protein
MPFTLAHPAAVLPFHSKWRTGFLALMIGSLGPDIHISLLLFPAVAQLSLRCGDGRVLP